MWNVKKCVKCWKRKVTNDKRKSDINLISTSTTNNNPKQHSNINKNTKYKRKKIPVKTITNQIEPFKSTNRQQPIEYRWDAHMHIYCISEVTCRNQVIKVLNHINDFFLFFGIAIVLFFLFHHEVYHSVINWLKKSHCQFFFYL